MASEARDLEHLDLSTDLVAPRRRPSLVAVASEADSSWIGDVCDLPAHLIGELPLPAVLRLRAIDGSVFHLSGGNADVATMREAGMAVLDRDEWSALVLATEADRVWPVDLVRALRARGVSGRLTLDSLLDGITAEQARRDAGRLFSMGKVLARLGARLDAVRIDDAAPDALADLSSVAGPDALERANDEALWELAS